MLEIIGYQIQFPEKEGLVFAGFSLGSASPNVQHVSFYFPLDIKFSKRRQSKFEDFFHSNRVEINIFVQESVSISAENQCVV